MTNDALLVNETYIFSSLCHGTWNVSQIFSNKFLLLFWSIFATQTEVVHISSVLKHFLIVIFLIVFIKALIPWSSFPSPSLDIKCGWTEGRMFPWERGIAVPVVQWFSTYCPGWSIGVQRTLCGQYKITLKIMSSASRFQWDI